MKGACVLVLLWAALLLISGGNCEICPAVKRDVDLFLTGTPDEYVEQVAQYKALPVVLENARILKNCVDAKMTEEDKENALSVLDKIYTSPLC
uniref:Major allergen I polypeptide chain 1 n=1 Tax=Felis catus TaxID=9685 RepID=FEL1A_FELCA|nr:RecName: Full=Major allergen I polypeptide chain 1; AltName: Full=AG4; AltName: Full=Allergen Cat-1; AltName: Full=Allergen Fel d I-A; Short=Allergen FdI; Short=Allergen Fel dI; AltName: Allergen=Fel d 1-A; Flags: Precursor [Felis catus]